ncbi:class A beta-lactamase-related serine hydrolase [Fulvivirga sp. RKSG066]|uniref:serine hydrolase domain-containing protein n=1 Tax=Fulvivirga aurantia TaxID=2529383 RepID=UPI0012BCAE04|nr:serine hydrolase domain-containing protein [Fulvivirga aurantia]MTI20191.1 class A beta-lactamase-related serine hydrolase [Fulvivirga aurantia]
MKQKYATTGRVLYPLSLLFFLFLLSCGKPDKKENAKEISERSINTLASKIDSILSTNQPRIFNGVILIRQGKESLYVKEHGYADFENKIPISINDKFRIMSNSKQITAVLVLKEVEKGNIDLQKPVGAYLSNLPQSWSDTVTVHQLLNMSSGISDLEKPLLFKPGNGFHYSNPGYGLLGKIIESVTHKSYASNANDLFKGLGMNNTYCYELQGTNEGLINGHALLNGDIEVVDFERFGFDQERWDNFLPAGGIVSDAYDISTWDIKLHHGELLSQESYQQMITPTNWGAHAVFDSDTIGYGYGLRIHDKYPVFHLGHGGRGFGFVSVKFYIPEKDIDVVIWENIYHMDNFPNNADVIYHFENEIRKIILNSDLVK